MITLTGLPTAARTRADRSQIAQAGRVEHVGARGLERLEPADGIVEIGAAIEEVLGARGEREREGQRLGSLGRRRDALAGEATS